MNIKLRVNLTYLANLARYALGCRGSVSDMISENYPASRGIELTTPRFRMKCVDQFGIYSINVTNKMFSLTLAVMIFRYCRPIRYLVASSCCRQPLHIDSTQLPTESVVKISSRKDYFVLWYLNKRMCKMIYLIDWSQQNHSY